MSIDLIPEDDLRAALRPYRVDPDAFEAGVRERLKAAETQPFDEPLGRVSPLLRSAAAFLPLEVLAGCKGTAAAAKLAPVGGAYKLLGYLAFPAISLFVLLGATIFSIFKIRTIQNQTGSGLSDDGAIREATREWWRRHKWGAWAVFAATMILMLVGATWILFLFYLISFGLLLLVLSSYAKVGLGNRTVIGRSCGMGLMFLGQAASLVGIGNREIHFLDQKLVAAILYGGVLILLPYIIGGLQLTSRPAETMEKTPRWFWGFLAIHWLVMLLLMGAMWTMSHNVWLMAILLVGALAPVASMVFRTRIARQRIGSASQWWATGFMAILLVPLMAWMMNSILWPATPSRIKHFVESFEEARFSMVSWQKWEIVARWVIDSKLDPDLSRPRRLLADEIAGEQNPYILGSALRVGLLPADQVSQLKEYESRRRALVAAPPAGMKPQVISSLEQHEWVIRAAVLRNELSPAERDRLEQRLYATLENMSQDKYVVLQTALEVTQVLEVIGRPIDRDQYRETIHDWLRKFHVKNTGWSQLAGGFKQYLIWPAGAWLGQPGSLEPTAYAVELMEIYGVPDDLDLNWVRSFLRPGAYIMDQKWVAAATLDRLNHLPGVTRPTWLDYLYYERSLLAAAVLVGLCFYATLSSPKAKARDAAERSAANPIQAGEMDQPSPS